MGGAVSSGRNNNELIDNLMGSKYIRTRSVELVFRALDRAEYMLPTDREKAYKDLAWRSGSLHLSAPCIYSEVMEALELKSGLTFLNIGSGTGFLSSLAGLLIGSTGINHGVEVHGMVIEYSNRKLKEFMENSAALDEFDFCEPKFFQGNGLCLAPLQVPYDRVYCGAGCPEEYQNYFKQLIKIGGILVMPLNDNLVQIRRTSETEWTTRNLLNVTFQTLKIPTEVEAAEHIKLDDQIPPKLQVLARAVIRNALRERILSKNPTLKQPFTTELSGKKSCPRRICIPIDDDNDVEGLNALHDLDRSTGSTEMNALLSLVLSMGQNRVAGALRLDPMDSSSSDSSDDDMPPREYDDDDDDDDDEPPPDADRPAEAQAPLPLRESMSRAIQRAVLARQTFSLAYSSDDLESFSDDAQEMPSEVEICVQKESGASEGMDVGAGEGCSGAAVVNSASSRTESEIRSDTLTDDTEDGNLSERRQRAKRAHGSGSSPQGEQDAQDADDEQDTHRHKRRAPDVSRDARRQRLSLLMKRSVKELPLPYELKRYVNLHRCFQI